MAPSVQVAMGCTSYCLLPTVTCNAVAPQQLRGRGLRGGLVALGQLCQHVRGEEVAEEGVAAPVRDTALAQAGARRGGQAQIGPVRRREEALQALADALGQAGARAFS